MSRHTEDTPDSVCQHCGIEVAWAARTEDGYAGFAHVDTNAARCGAEPKEEDS